MKSEEGKSKGFGFVSFDTPEEAQVAVDDLNGKDLEGKTLYCGRAQKKAERQAELKKKFDALKQERMQRYQGIITEYILKIQKKKTFSAYSKLIDFL